MTIVRSAVIRGVQADPVQLAFEHTEADRLVFELQTATETQLAELHFRFQAARAHVAGWSPAKVVERSLPARGASVAPLDLAILCGLRGLAPRLNQTLVVGELGYSDDRVRPVCGVTSMTLLARESGLKSIIVPQANVAEATAVAGDLQVIGIDRADAVTLDALPSGAATSSSAVAPFARAPAAALPEVSTVLFAFAQRLAASPRNVLLIGRPGSGRTLVARRVPALLPAMSEQEQRDVWRAYSAAGLVLQTEPVAGRPFRAPHHTVSAAGLVGAKYQLGEVSLATHGVLFLDELDNFTAGALNALVDTLRSPRPGVPAAPACIIGSAAPCACGWFGSDFRACRCPTGSIARYTRRLTEYARALDMETVELPDFRPERTKS